MNNIATQNLSLLLTPSLFYERKLNTKINNTYIEKKDPEQKKN